jgi:hypothetical protein
MISGMPIGYKTKVRMILIKKSPHNEGTGIGCYPSWLWSPVSVPIRGEYDDYGSMDPHPDDMEMLELSLAALNKHLHPVELGANQYHDIAVGDISSWKVARDALRAGRILIKNRYTAAPPSPLTRVYIREEVWQAMLSMKDSERSFWRSKDRACGDGTLEGNYKVANAWFDIYLSEAAKYKNSPSSVPGLEALGPLMAQSKADLGSEFDLWFKAEGQSHLIRSEIIFEMRDKLTNGTWTRESPMFVKLLDGLCELDHVNGMMRMPGKIWMPMATCGQEYHWGTTKKFYKKMLDIATALKKDYDEDR